MFNNKLHNTRNSARFNSQFVPASEPQNQQQAYPGTPRPQRQPNQNQQPQPSYQDEIMQDDVTLKTEPAVEDETDAMTSKNEERPAWMKSKLSGVKKISNKERRRRQNETLRRLLTPKNALMVLNEMMPHEQLANQFKVEAAQNQFFARNPQSFCADLTVEGSSYKGYGDNKLSARNAAAEQAIRDLIIKKMNKALLSDGGSASGEQGGEEGGEEEALPMIQLASFALHKLFAEWECEGHKVPQLRPSSASVSESADSVVEAAGGKKKSAPRSLPADASAMHPCMLLTHMRPRLEYRELAASGDKPQNMLFTIAVDVDNHTYVGKASNKREARRAAAAAACAALFNVHFINKL